MGLVGATRPGGPPGRTGAASRGPRARAASPRSRDAGTCRVQPAAGGATGGRNLARSNGALLGRSALDRSAEAGAAEERALEDEEAGDWQEAGDEHRREEDAERGLGLD